LDALAERIEGILRRKGQVVLYGPPGTGGRFTFAGRRAGMLWNVSFLLC
jgi:ATP-dependent 26S proteasome regulatory subunit